MSLARGQYTRRLTREQGEEIDRARKWAGPRTGVQLLLFPTRWQRARRSEWLHVGLALVAVAMILWGVS